MFKIKGFLAENMKKLKEKRIIHFLSCLSTAYKYKSVFSHPLQTHFKPRAILTTRDDKGGFV